MAAHLSSISSSTSCRRVLFLVNTSGGPCHTSLMLCDLQLLLLLDVRDRSSPANAAAIFNSFSPSLSPFQQQSSSISPQNYIRIQLYEIAVNVEQLNIYKRVNGVFGPRFESAGSNSNLPVLRPHGGGGAPSLKLFKRTQRSQRQQQISPALPVNSIRFILALMLTIFLVVPFLFYSA